jgi:hypothetical protein
MHADPLEQLRDLVFKEEQKIFESFPLERRIGLMEIARSMDHGWLMPYRGLPWESDWRRIEQLNEFGLNKALSLFVDGSTKGERFPLMPSTVASQQWADSVLQHCGRLGLCEHLIEVCRVGLGAIEAVGPDRYIFRYTSDPVGLELLEREDGAWFQGLVSKLQEDELGALEKDKPKVRGLISGLVKPWNDAYIQYEAHPEVDAYYEREGILFAQKMFGQDSFSGDAVFGGEPFDLYRGTVGVLVGWCLKHVDFCGELLKKHPDINIRNVVTVPQDRDVKVRYLAAALEVDQGVAEQALSVVTLSLENIDKHCSVPGNFAAPAVIVAGEGRLICPVWGCLSHPFQFMLEELKRSYRPDWDRAVDGREIHFRQELYELFPGERFKKIHRSAKIRIDSKTLTDVDALILDRESGVVALFQLKWQDTFRHAVRERESRKRNFQRSSNEWVSRVIEWLGSRGVADSARELGLGKEDVGRVRRFVLFIIGRNASYFSGSGSLDSRAAWGNWYQVLRVFEGSRGILNPLLHLFNAMIEGSPLSRALPSIPAAELKICDTVITIEAVERDAPDKR